MLLFGCTSEPKPKEGLQGVVVGSTEEMIGGIEPAKQPDSQGAKQQGINCFLTVRQEGLVAGGQADVSIMASFPGTMQFDFSCGNETRRLQGDGRLSLTAKCNLNEPGFQRMSLSSSGQECASAIIGVAGKGNGACYIDNASVQRDLGSYNYKWIVYFDGFANGDAVSWVCDSEIGKKIISTDPMWGLPRYQAVSCSFASRPKSDSINVMVGGKPCGQVSTR